MKKINIVLIVLLLLSIGAIGFLFNENEQYKAQLADSLKKIDDYEHPKGGVQEFGALHVDGYHVMDQNNQILQLRGFSSHGLLWYPEYTNYAAIQTTKAAGANTFRIAMYSDGSNGYVNNEKLATKMAFGAIENVIANDMYAIVDWHILNDGNPLQNIEYAKTFFETIASYYKDHPAIIYEICNEPNGATTWSDVSTYANTIIPIIRQYAPNSIILVGTPKYSSDLKSAMEAPLAFENIMYTYHQYLNSVSGNYMYNLNTAVEANFPVFISEWGTGNLDGDGVVNEENTRTFLSYLNEHQISWINWSLSNKAEGTAALDPNSNIVADWTLDQLSPSGKIVYEYLNP